MRTKEHRYKVLKVSAECIAEIMIYGDIDRGFIIKLEHDMPDDAEYIRCYHSIVSDYFSFVFYHKSWDIVDEGEEYPSIVVKQKQHKISKLPPMSQAISCDASKLDNSWIPEDFQSALTYDEIEEGLRENKIVNSMCVPSLEGDVIKKKWVNVMGEDYPEPKELYYKMFHICAHELLIDDFRDMIFNPDSSIRTEYNIPDGSKCIRYYLDILVPRYHIIFSHESFGIWHGYSAMMKEIADGEFEVCSGLPRYDKDTRSTKFKLVSEEIFDKVLDKMKPVKDDPLDDFLDKYSEII